MWIGVCCGVIVSWLGENELVFVKKFFLQAEVGIRVVEEFRVLGDVYKGRSFFFGMRSKKRSLHFFWHACQKKRSLLFLLHACKKTGGSFFLFFGMHAKKRRLPFFRHACQQKQEAPFLGHLTFSTDPS